MMRTVGITGGIGSGKTTVCNALSALGYAVYSADERAKVLMHEDPSLRAALEAEFGPATYLPNGSLNRPHLAATVFADPIALARLNALVHPAVRRDVARWRAGLEQQGDAKPLCFREAAILYESGSHADCHAVVCVYAPQAVRLTRAMQRGNATEADILHRMAQQWPESEKIRRADFTIFNDGAHALLPQVAAMLRALR